jgi:hypothetical protein
MGVNHKSHRTILNEGLIRQAAMASILAGTSSTVLP